jgi:hypothetical protein
MGEVYLIRIPIYLGYLNKFLFRLLLILKRSTWIRIPIYLCYLKKPHIYDPIRFRIGLRIVLDKSYSNSYESIGYIYKFGWKKIFIVR